MTTLQNVAGVAGFEPTNVGTKSRCLTTWRHPKYISCPICKIKMLSWQAFFISALRFFMFFSDFVGKGLDFF